MRDRRDLVGGLRTTTACLILLACGFVACKSSITVDKILSKKFDPCSNAATNTPNGERSALFCSPATALGWVEPSPQTGPSATAIWTKSTSNLLVNQKIQFFEGVDCNIISGPLIDLGSGTVQSYEFKGSLGGTYSFRLTSLDAKAKAIISDCSPAMMFSEKSSSTPTVTSVSSPETNGRFAANHSISITISFSDVVTVTGSPQLQLETGITDAVAIYSSGSGSKNLTFTYNVLANHTAMDLDYQSTEALSLNGGTIRGISNNNASLILPVPGAANSLGANKDIVVDTIPTVIIASNRDPGPTNNSNITLTFSFSEPVTGFDVSDIVVTQATKGVFTAVSTNVYTLAVSPSGSNITASVAANVASDVSGNGNIYSEPWALFFDNTAPTVTIASNRDPGPTNQSTITLTVTFSEPVTGFNEADIVITNGVKGAFSATSSTLYSLVITATGSNVSASVPADAGFDAAANGNIASLPWSITFDNQAPAVTVTSNRDPGPTNNPAIILTLTFSEAVTGFGANDINVANGTKGTFTVISPSVYSLSVTATGGTILCDVPANAALDAASNGNSSSNAFALTYDTSGPVIQSLSINGNAASTSKRYLNVSMTVSDALGSKVTHICLKYINAISPALTSDCWLPVTAHPMNLTPQATLTVTNYPMAIGFPPGAYTIFGFAKDELGNISTLSAAGSGTSGIDKNSINYAPGVPATVHSLIVANTQTPTSITPPKNETIFTTGQTVYIKWRITDNSSIPANAISLFYTTNDSAYQVIAESLNNGTNAGCQIDHAGTSVDDNATGCFVWTAPSNQYFAIQLRVTDAEGIQSLFRSGILNGLGLRVIAGSTDPGIDGSAQAAVFLHQYIPSDAKDGNNILVGSDGRIYFMDATRGVLYVNPTDGAVRVLLAKGTTITGDGGPVASATMRETVGIAFDHQERVLVYDFDRIRRIDTTQNPMTIERLIGGGSDQSDTTTATALQVPNLSGVSDRAVFPFFATPDGKIYFTTTYYYGNFLKNTRLRVFNPSTGIVSTIRFSGIGTSVDSQAVVSECWGMNIGLSFDFASSVISKIVAKVAHFNSTPFCTTPYYDQIALISFSADGVSSAPHPSGAPYGTAYLLTGMNGALYAGHGGGIARFNQVANSWEHQLGTGAFGSCDDGTPALTCKINAGGFFVDRQGRIYFVEMGRIRMVTDDGKVVTLVGQGFAGGDGGLPTSARFSYVRNLAYTDAGKIIALDSNASRIREVTPGINIQTVAGNGNSGAPNFTEPATNQHIQTAIFGDDVGLGVDRTSGTIYFGSGLQLVRLNRINGLWEPIAGNGSTNFASADGLIGFAIDLGAYITHVVGYGNGKAITHMGSYSGSTHTHYDQMLKLYDVNDQGRQSHLLGRLGNLSSDFCTDGTRTNLCAVPIEVYPQYSPAIYDTYSGRWLLMQINSVVIRTVEEGPAATIGTLVTLPRSARSFTYYRNSSASIRKVFYCGYSDGLVYEYNLNTGLDIAIPWPATTMRCNGYSIEYDVANNRLVFPVTQDKLSAIAELSL